MELTKLKKIDDNLNYMYEALSYANKQEAKDILSSLEKSTVKLSEILGEDCAYNIICPPKIRPSDLQKYDVIYVIGAGNKCHYQVVYRIVEDLVWSVPISSKDKLGAIPINESRLFGGDYFIPNMVISEKEYALKSWRMIWDSKKEFDAVIRQIKGIFKTQLGF